MVRASRVRVQRSLRLAVAPTGLLVLLGPTVDNTKVFGTYEAESEAVVRQLVEGDPYWQNGIWTEYSVYEWNQVF